MLRKLHTKITFYYQFKLMLVFSAKTYRKFLKQPLTLLSQVFILEKINVDFYFSQKRKFSCNFINLRFLQIFATMPQISLITHETLIKSKCKLKHVIQRSYNQVNQSKSHIMTAPLEHPLGVQEAGVRSPTVSHQRCKTGRFALLSLPIGTSELGNGEAGSESV